MFVIPIGGEGKRFKQVGIDRPKWALPLAGRPVLFWVLSSFSKTLADEEFCIVFLGDKAVRGTLERIASRAGLSSCRFEELTAPTRGQAETVQFGLERASVALSEPVTIFNCDTLRPRFEIPESKWSSDGYLECVEAPGSHWSFVRPGIESGSVREVVEKRRISTLCSTGLYRFGERSGFEDSFRTNLVNNTPGEIFVAPLYNHLINRGRRVEYGVIGRDEVEFCGTPEEYLDCKVRESEIEAKFLG